MKKISLLSLCLVVPILAAALLSGCAGMSASVTEDLLSASGFNIKTPETPKQKEIYDGLQPYKMETGIINGKRLYGYKDEKKGVVYVGGEQQYQTYQRLLVERNIANQNMMAAQMNQMTVQRYAMFVPYGYRR